MTSPNAVLALNRGVMVWNAWRAKARRATINLGDINLDGRDLNGINFRGVKLFDASLRGTQLNYARLDKAQLVSCDLTGASLMNARLEDTLFVTNVSLRGVNLRGADLSSVRFWDCDMTNADLCDALLAPGDIFECILDGTNFSQCAIGYTNFTAVDLSVAKGLTSVQHSFPSALDVQTLRFSKGRVPAEFLKGCGFSDSEIAIAPMWDPSLTEDQLTDILYEVDRLRGQQPLQMRAVFISYSHLDSSFVDLLEERLSADGVRCWRDVHNLKSGRLERQVDRAIRLHPIVVLVLSRHSVESDWVEWEASRAREVEQETKKDMLCPIALDASWRDNEWSSVLRRQVQKYHILDFSDWREESSFGRKYKRLLSGLRSFYT